jgi:anthranilate synthase/aminodeoxychorismate synthase-like glutamine amidotransferase
VSRTGVTVPAGARLLLVDNYDSFTWNLAHYLAELGARVEVRRNDRLDLRQVLAGRFEGIVISPGPGRPEGAGISLELIRHCPERTPLLGVCLGHQALAMVHGARIVRAAVLVHGKTSAIHHDGSGLFAGLPRPFVATRYHSLVVEPGSLGEALRVTARTEEGVVMGIRHRRLPQHGVQFHPESILTREGKRLLGNFLAIVGEARMETARVKLGSTAEADRSPALVARAAGGE